jgi:6-pyruvoyl-tetrahydropterin synthase-like protein/outer membrane lipoprotein YfiO
MGNASLRGTARALIDVFTVGAAVAFVASYFPWSLMGTETTTNGGDMGSHYYPAYYLYHTLLPKGRVSGWCPGNYCGFPIFQFYFPLTFVLMAALAPLLTLLVSFKVVSVLGGVILPLCAYLSLRLMGTPFPGPALGALATLPFIFMEANSMWGGNIPSTLAGEFSLSFGLALTILFFGTIRYTMATGRGRIWNGLLVALIGLSHGYTLLWAGFGSLVELATSRRWWWKIGVLVCVHGLAILLMAFWIFPMIAYAPWTTAYNHSWPIRSWQEVLPPVLWPGAIGAAATLVLNALVSAIRRTPFPRPLITLWGVMIVSAIFYLAAFSFHVVDIRFVPFIQLGLGLAAAAGLGFLLGPLVGAEVWPLVAAFVLLPWVQSRVTFIPSWIKWNYSGFEKKATWSTLHALMDKIKGDYRDPRVVYEHSPDHEALGTVRVFEIIPLFSGRSTLEGLYMQGSPTAPFVFYLQSEISKDISCPFPDWGCARLNLDDGLAHLRMMNVSEFIVKSDKVKALAAVHPGLEREAQIGNTGYEIYRLKDNDGHYAVPLATRPFLVRTPQWKEASYRWFKRATPDSVVPVFAQSVTPEEEKLFAGSSMEPPRDMPRQTYEQMPTLEEHMDAQDRIRVTGCRPGQPVLVRISYHPRWQSTTGERVWLAGPSFMLVFPKGESFELVFGDGPPVRIGNFATLLGLLIFVGAFVPPLRRLGTGVAGSVAEVVVGSPLGRPIRWMREGEWPDRTRRLLVVAGLVATAAGVFVFTRVAEIVPAEQLYREGQKYYDAGDFERARPLLQEAQRRAPLAAIAVHAAFFEAISYYRQNRWAEAEATFKRLVENFPEGVNAPEATYHIGLCRNLQGDPAGAIATWESVQRLYPTSDWAKYAGQRIAEIKR